MKNKPTESQLIATRQALRLQAASSDREFADTLGISRTTLYKRLETSNWKKSEVFYINYLNEQKNEEDE